MGRFARGLFGGQLFKDEKSLAEMLDFRELTRLEGGGLISGYGLGLISFKAPDLPGLKRKRT
jgi:hypothetical protein